jgi:hypothetical protein
VRGRRRALASYRPQTHLAERFGVDFHPRYAGKLLQKLGFAHISARPRHPAQGERIIEASKKLPTRAEGSSRRPAEDDAG